ncbi:MAG: hypothetical protein ED557_03135 [Balneola sp.]|nr:MAG: hypothetical protein ED557_03135 [Balneola sp.]
MQIQLFKTNKVLRATCLIVALLYLANCQSQVQETEDLLASINELDINIDHFENAYKEYYYRTGQVLNPDISTKKAILDAEFDTYVLATYAEDLEIHKSDEAIVEKQRIERRVLNEEYLNQIILSGIEVSDQELQEYFLRFNTQIRASHIYAQTEAGILEFKDRLDNGETFDDLAKEAFRNEYLSENGGDIGWFTTDELDIAFENSAFGLQIGEVSEPVKTVQGYSLIKVTDRVSKPIITEYEFNQKRAQLGTYVLKKKRELKTREHLDQFINGLQFDLQVDELWENVNQNLIGFRNRDIEFVSNLPRGSRVLATYGDIEFTSSDFIEELTISSDQVVGFVVDESSFKEFFTGLAYRNYLYKESISNGLAEQELVSESINETYYHYLSREAENALRDQISNTPAELYNEFLANRSNFIKPLEANFARVVVRSKEEAERVRNLILSGTDFSEVVDKYTVNNEDRFTNGELGLASIKEFGYLELQLSKLEVGDISEVIQYQENEFHIYKCLYRVESKALIFSEASSYVDDFLTKKKLKELRSETISDVKKKHNAFIDLKKLEELIIQI